MKKNPAALLLPVFLAAVLSAGGAKAVNDNLPLGGRQAGMGNSAVSLYDFWAISHNQAGLAGQQHTGAGFYIENRYLTKEMSLGAVAVAFPAANGVFGINVTYFGFSQYHESKAGLSYARKFGQNFSAGMQLNYLYTYLGPDAGSSGTVAAELGVICQLLPQVNLGVHLFNPTGSRIGSSHGENIPRIIRLGVSWMYQELVLIALETEKDMDQHPVFRAGLDYQVVKNVFLRGGIGSQPVTNSFGFGLKLGNLDLDLSSSFHQILGYSPQFSLTYFFR